MSRKTISDKLLQRKTEINAPAPAGPAAYSENQRLAQAAIIGGIKSPAWKTYMLQFVDVDGNGQPFQDQLTRLLATDGDPREPLARNRAYLVSNGMCGDFTRAHFEETVMTIDDGIPADPTP